MWDLSNTLEWPAATRLIMEELLLKEEDVAVGIMVRIGNERKILQISGLVS